MSEDVQTLLGSGSNLFRSLECPASTLLPQVVEPHERAQKAAERGTAIHTFYEYAPEGVEDALKMVEPKHWNTCRQMDVMEMASGWTYPTLREVKFVYHGLTGDVRIVGKGGPREYYVESKWEVPLTVDVVITGFKTAEIWDLKTGKTPVPRPAVNPQLLHGALCAGEALAPRAETFLLGLQKLKGKGRLENEFDTVTRWDLEAHADRIRQAQKTAVRVEEQIGEGKDPEVNPGPWCKYCKAAPVCPAS